jgi:transposase
MVWSAFSAIGKLPIIFVRGNINSECYQEILSNFLLPYFERWPHLEFTFMQDNAPVHTSRSTKDWLQTHQVEVMRWPPRSPDLNPIENAWGMLARSVYENGRQYANIEQLKEAIKSAWDNLQLSDLNKLANTMPKRMIEVIKKGGGIIRY